MNTHKIFQTPDDKPAFEPSVCVYMDVLGFVDSQQNSFKNGNGDEEFQRFYSSVTKELDSLNEADPDSDTPYWKLKVFTDNIVLGHPIRAQHPEAAIGNVAMAVARYQLGMARAGYFVRGGFSFDALFMDDYVVYGPALLEAYELEHETARDPRIILSHGVKTLVQTHFNYYAQPQEAPQNHTFLLDSDGQVFLDYLAPCFDDFFVTEKVDTDTLSLHKQHIENRLRDFSAKPRVWAKYAWLATYHNFVIREWQELADLGEKFLIDGKLHRPSPVRICPFLIPPR